MGSIRYILVAILVAVYFLVPIPGFMYDPHGFYPALSHHFFHANIFHLAVNCLCVFLVYEKSRIVIWRDLVAAYIIGSLSFFFANSPTIGFSNMLFAMVGLRAPGFRSKWWRSRNTIIFLIMMVAMFFIPKVSALTHLISFVLGVFVGAIGKTINRISYDTRRAQGCK